MHTVSTQSWPKWPPHAENNGTSADDLRKVVAIVIIHFYLISSNGEMLVL